VTEQNTRAVSLYKKLGYKVQHRFDAMLWEKTRRGIERSERQS
jgi:ribosomal protein S18 acetylase RimI-like enzyme